MKNLQSIAVILSLLAGGIHGLAGELTNPSVHAWVTESIPSPNPSVDYSPDSRLILPENEQFLIVQARFDIEWKDSENEKESLKYHYAQLHIDTAGGEKIVPVAALTSDGRVDTFSNAERKTMEAREDWGAEELRWGALFIVPKSSAEMVKLVFDGQSYPVKVESGAVPHPIEFLKIQSQSTAWLKSSISEAGSERRFPSARTQLEFENQGLLCVSLSIHALKPNVLGGENRMIFRPSDFSLKTELGSIEPYGVMGRWGNKVIRNTIYNVSRTSLKELPEAEQIVKLLFKVPAGFTHGDLAYFGRRVSEVKAPTE